MLVNLKEILNDAKKGGYAVPAFNVYNMETVMGVIYAAERLHAPVIIQSYSRLFKEDTSFFIAPMVLAAANRAKVPVCYHLDHGASELETNRALRLGCTGVMIDASTLDFDGNAALTRRVVETAAYSGVYVEGELGHVGSVNDDAMDEFTEPEQAARFVRETGVAALAVLVGSAHGKYKKPPKLDIQRTLLPQPGSRLCCTAAPVSRMIRSARQSKQASARSTMRPTSAMRLWIRLPRRSTRGRRWICL